jgi:O-succinylbenzoate synthase
MMNKEVWLSHYTLRLRKGPGNAVSSREELSGVLIRVDNGFGCMQPWPELGDPTLARCLEDLRGERQWPIVRRALRCAEMDGIARDLEDWMFEEMEVPVSHGTLSKADRKELELLVEEGFRVVKLKCGRQAVREGLFLREMSAAFPKVRWRLDFNEAGTAAEARDFILGLPDEVRRRIEFVEDPCPYAEDAWKTLRKECGVKLAVDREASPQCAGADVVVIKPAVDEPWLLAEAAALASKKVVVTSYMDHPLGQAFAAWEAGRLALQFPGLVERCGLQTHGLFEPNAFTEALGAPSPEFSPCEGLGLGFDDLLNELIWTSMD